MQPSQGGWMRAGLLDQLPSRPQASAMLEVVGNKHHGAFLFWKLLERQTWQNKRYVRAQLVYVITSAFLSAVCIHIVTYGYLCQLTISSCGF